MSCGYGGASDDAIARNLSCCNYVAAENLREPCGPGAANRTRLVYKGIYDEQNRSYDVRELPDTRRAAFTAFARGDGDPTQGIPITNLLRPWRGERVYSVIIPRSFRALRAALNADRFTGVKPIGLRLSSREFYWVVAGWLDGRFQANAWVYSSQRFKSLKFPRILLENDKTGIAFSEAVRSISALMNLKNINVNAIRIPENSKLSLEKTES